MTIEFTLNKKDIYNEVALTTSYTGKKMDDVTAYERIFTTDEDRMQLERFWQESQAEVCQELIRVIESEMVSGDTYNIALKVSSSFDMALKETLKESMGLSLRNYFVKSITAKWFTFTNKSEAGEYEAHAKALLDDVKRKAFYKKMPTRPSYD